MAEGTLTGATNNGKVTVEGGNQPIVEHWAKKTFSEDFNNRHFDKFQSFENPDKVGESYLALQTKMSQTGRLPAADAPKEEWESFYKAWGRPEAADKYSITDELKTSMGDENFQKSVMSMAHTLGLNNKQFEQMAKWGVEQAAAMGQAKAAETQKNLTALRAEWGFAYDQNVNLAGRALMTLLDGNKDDPFMKYLDDTGMSDHPAVIKFFYRIGKNLGEDELINGDGRSSASDKDEALKQINDIRADTKHPFNDARHPNHKRAVDEMQELYKVAYAG